MTTRENLRALTCETLRLRLAQVHLSQVGKKEVLVERLFQHLQVSERAGEEDGSDSDSSTSTVDSRSTGVCTAQPQRARQLAASLLRWFASPQLGFPPRRCVTSTLGQPPNHDQRLGLGHRPTQW